MKRFIIAAVSAALFALAAFADFVAPEKASEIAEAFVETKGSRAKVSRIRELGNLYFVSMSPEGFVLVASDDSSEPVFGYSLEGSASPESIPENMLGILGEASDEVARARGRSRHAGWSRLESGVPLMSSGARSVENLIKVNWNQSSPYNKRCPGTGSSKALVGCVAVAMGQAMSVQRFPEAPTGSVSYVSGNYGILQADFDSEPPYDWNAIASGENQKDEVARLLYHAGLSVSMDYGPDGSGIPSTAARRIPEALRNNFGYSSQTTLFWRSQYGGDWEGLLLNELLEGRAVVYNAVDSKGGYGHSFNLDGWDGSMFHVNWGWGGYGNGYFSISSLADASMNMNYDSQHVAVVGIGASASTSLDISLSELIVDSRASSGDPVCAILVNRKPASDDLYTVQVTGTYDALSGTYFAVPFECESGILKLSGRLSEACEIRVKATSRITGISKTSYFTMVPVDSPSLESRVRLSYDKSSEEFEMSVPLGSECSVVRPDGTSAFSGSASSSPFVRFGKSDLGPGESFLKVSLKEQSKTIKIVI